jgi:hypothetical protein
MRDYRHRKRAQRVANKIAQNLNAGPPDGGLGKTVGQRIQELEEEVRHLKAELAKRQPVDDWDSISAMRSFNSRPFTPVPKRRG